MFDKTARISGVSEAMSSTLKKHLSTFLIAAITAAATAATPGIAASIGGEEVSPRASEAGVLAALHTVRRSGGQGVKIDQWFNSVSGTKPSITGSHGFYVVDWGFRVKQDYPACTIDHNYVDTRDAICTVYRFRPEGYFVETWDTGTLNGPARQRDAEIWVTVSGP